MKFIVTGGNGFLGGSLIRRLTDAGHQVVLVGRTEPPTTGDNVSFFQADITDIDSLRACKKATSSIDGIVHLAALVPKTREEDQAAPMLEVNVTGTLNLLEVFGSSIRNFVYASTAEVYGLPDGHKPLSETTTVPRPLSYYGASKLAGELFSGVYGRNHDLPVSALRFTVLYGPGDTIARAVPNFIRKALAGEDLEVFGGEELRDYLHVTDAAEALYLAATKAPNGIYNIGTGRGISVKDTAQAILDAVNPKLKLKLLPRQKKAADIVLDIGKAQQDFGFQPKHRFPDLIDEQVAWHQHN